jgi:hypothetical protein
VVGLGSFCSNEASFWAEIGVIIIRTCCSSTVPGLPYEKVLEQKVVDHQLLGSIEVNENKIKHKLAIFGVFMRVLSIALFFSYCSHFCPQFCLDGVTKFFSW